MEIDKPFGIDLGTTNSCIGVLDDQDREVILYRDAGDNATVPSCVWWDERANEIVVGLKAFRRRGAAPEPVISIKRSMGTLLLTPLGRRGVVPTNLPAPLARALTETAAERLERHLAAIVDDDPRRQEAKRAAARANPPPLWTFDQDARLAAHARSLADPAERAEIAANPPWLWLPQEISALILAELRANMADMLRRKFPGDTRRVERAVITVPAYFGSEQIEATKEAGQLAGWSVLELLQEPTAAARYHCWKNKLDDGVFLVFDLGGGTFDVSVVRRQDGVFDVLGVSGDNFLGGDDLDRQLAEWLRRELAAHAPDCRLELDLTRAHDRRVHKRLVMLAERLKKALSDNVEFQLEDEWTLKDLAGNTVPIKLTLARTAFEAMIERHVARCLPKCWEALAKAKKKADVSLRQVDAIFLVGGSTYIPLVRRLVKDWLCAGGADVYKGDVVERLLADITGDDSADAEALRGHARAMLAAGERAKRAEPLLDAPDLCVALGAAVCAAAHGARSRADQRRAVIEILSPRGASENRVTVKGRVSGVDAAALRGAEARLESDPPGVNIRAPLGADGGFVFVGASLARDGENKLRLTITSASGETLGETPLTITRSADHSDIASELDAGPTVAKPFSIDVKSRGRVEKLVLVESGAALPATAAHTLRVSEPNTGTVEFRVWQGRRLLKTILAPIDPGLPSGTPIYFTFAISKDHLTRVQYQVGQGGALESAIVEPPPPQEPPDPAQARACVQEIEDALSAQPEVEAQVLRNRLRKASERLEEARRRGDQPQLIDAFDELRDLQREATQADTRLEPAWDRYEADHARCHDLLNRIEEVKPHYPAAATRDGLRGRRDEAWAAYQSRDQQLYGEAWARLQALLEGLEEQLRVKPPPTTTRSPAERALAYVDELLRWEEKLNETAGVFQRQFAHRLETSAEASAKDQSRRYYEQCQRCLLELASSAAALRRLQPRCEKEASAVISECGNIERTLSRWRGTLVAQQGILTGKRDESGIPSK